MTRIRLATASRRGRMQTLSTPAAGAPAFDPTTIAGLALWLKADGITSLADGAAVATWPDESGNAYDAAQATASAQPTFRTNVLNGQPVVRFDGASDFMSTPLFSPTFSVFTHFIVVARRAIDAVHYFSDNVGGPNPCAVYATTGVPDTWVIRQGGTLTGGNAENLDPHVVTSVFNTLSSLQRVDGTQVMAGSTGGAVAMNGRRLGTYRDANALWLNGDIAEVLVYDGLLSDEDRGAVEGYLGDKYGITVA